MARLISLNMERSKHLDRIIRFLCENPPDVVCLQELMDRDIEKIGNATGLNYSHYVPMAVHPLENLPFGIGILARVQFTEADVLTYAGAGDGTSKFDRSTPETRLATGRYAIARVRLAIGEQDLRIATTHFPWTPEGQAFGFQTEAVGRLLEIVRNDAIVLTGDFNAPRGGPIFGKLAGALTDCIPAQITTSIDPKLHRAGPLELMVDGMFSTRQYRVEGVRLYAGLSDHQAISGQIYPAEPPLATGCKKRALCKAASAGFVVSRARSTSLSATALARVERATS